MGFIELLSKRKKSGKKKGNCQEVSSNDYYLSSSKGNKEKDLSLEVQNNTVMSYTDNYSAMEETKIDTSRMFDQRGITFAATESPVGILHKHSHHSNSRHYGQQPSEELNNNNDEMFNIICEVLPYFNQGDTNIDNIITDTIEKLNYNTVDKRDQEGNSLLMLACQHGAHVLVQLLLLKGSDPNAQNIYGETCLHFASYSDSYSLDNAKLLVKYGANANICEFRFGCTSLHYAASMGYSELCRTLLAGGALVTIHDKSGCDPLRYAIQSQNESCIQILQNSSQWLITDNSTSIVQDVGINYESDWEQIIDDKFGMPFYHCKKTGRSLWESDYHNYRESKVCTEKFSSRTNDEKQISLVPSVDENIFEKHSKGKHSPVLTQEEQLLVATDKNKESREIHLHVNKDSSNQPNSVHDIHASDDVCNDVIGRAIDEFQRHQGKCNSQEKKNLVNSGIGDSDIRNEMWVSIHDFTVKEQEMKQKHEDITSNLNSKIDHLQDTVKTKELAISSLEDIQRQYQQRLLFIENTMNEEKQANADLQRQLEETQANISGMMSITQSLDDEKRKHQSIVSKLQSELKESREQHTANKESLMSQVQSYHEQILQQSVTISKLKEEIATCISSNQYSLRNLEKEWEKEKQEIEKKNHIICLELKNKLDEQQKIVMKADMEREKAFKDCEESKSKAAFAEDELNKMKSMITEAKSLFRANDDLHKSLNLEIEKRKELHNKLEDLKGKIRVYVRIRPLNGNEMSKLCKEVLVKEDKRTCVMHLDGSSSECSEKVKSWEFDKIFSGETNSQSHIFKDTKELVTSAVDGFNVCICCYGQTGSGKTFTMLGASGNIPLVDNVTKLPEDSGIAPRAAIELFEVLDKRSSSFDIYVTVNMFELYKDNLRDLIAVSQGVEIHPLRIKLGEHTASGLVEVDGAQQIQVKNAMELLSVFQTSSEMRSTACTKMNMESSRSHLIMIIIAKLVNKRTGMTTHGKLTLVDLAGSERVSKSGVSGTELKEAQSINKSLSALGDVINALTSGSKHIPYRNHPLTMLMSDSIGGRSKTLMFICCSPADYNASESSNSLEFAKRCKHVKNKGGNSALDDTAQLNALKMELARLKKEKGTLNVSRIAKGPRIARHHV